MSKASVSYYGNPIVKPPVWTWEIPLYFFVGGLAGMAAVIAAAAIMFGSDVKLARTALGCAAAGALISPLLLIKDLGRPGRFYMMLRVLKWRSPMSVGVWLLTGFSAFVFPSVLILERPDLAPTAEHSRALLITLSAGGGLFGALLATYTGVLIGATAIPVWHTNRVLLPIHFGVAALGSAAGLLELLGFRFAALANIGYGVSLVESGIGLFLELRRRGAIDRPLHVGFAAWSMRGAAILSGPAAIALRALGWTPVAATSFLAGALFSRYAWLWAGRRSALDSATTLTLEAQPRP